MDRKTFLKVITGALVLTAPFQLFLSCSTSEDPIKNDPVPDPVVKDCLANGTSTSISTNHGHTISVSKEDVSAGVPKTYNITGGATHTHQVIISAAHFGTLANNNQISVSSTSDSGHTHNVTVQCA